MSEVKEYWVAKDEASKIVVSIANKIRDMAEFWVTKAIDHDCPADNTCYYDDSKDASEICRHLINDRIELACYTIDMLDTDPREQIWDVLSEDERVFVNAMVGAYDDAIHIDDAV